MTTERQKRVKFLWRDEIDYLLLRVFKELGEFSHDEASSLFYLLKYLTSNSKRPFTPFYGDGYAINNLVRRGWVLQTRIMPPQFNVNNYGIPVDLDNEIERIYGRMYSCFENLVNDVAKADDKKSHLKNLEAASIAYNKLPEHLRIGHVMRYGVDEAEAYELLRKVEEYTHGFKLIF